MNDLEFSTIKTHLAELMQERDLHDLIEHIPPKQIRPTLTKTIKKRSISKLECRFLSNMLYYM